MPLQFLLPLHFLLPLLCLLIFLLLLLSLALQYDYFDFQYYYGCCHCSSCNFTTIFMVAATIIIAVVSTIADTTILHNSIAMAIAIAIASATHHFLE